MFCFLAACLQLEISFFCLPSTPRFWQLTIANAGRQLLPEAGAPLPLSFCLT
jgi:hypothetical protein